MTPVVRLRRLDDADPTIPLPTYETRGAAGADVRANLPAAHRDGIALEPGERRLIPTGFACEIDDGFEIQVRPRSGLALKHGLTLVNTPGTIDSDYRGPVGLLMINLGREVFTVKHGERLAQLVVAPVTRAVFNTVETLADTARGEGGFGSTGRD